MDVVNVNSPIPGFSTKLSPIYTVSINMGFSISQNQRYRGTSWIFIKIRKVSPKICFLKSFFLMRLYISEFIFPANIDFRFMDSIELENIFCHFPKFTKLVTSQHSYTKRTWYNLTTYLPRFSKHAMLLFFDWFMKPLPIFVESISNVLYFIV